MTTDLIHELRTNTTDPGDVLCIELLVAEGYWWTRQDFVNQCVTSDHDAQRFDPGEAINFAHVDRIATTGQLAFLRLALSFSLLYEAPRVWWRH